MSAPWLVPIAAFLCVVMAANAGVCQDRSAAPLPQGIKAVWDLDTAYRETTPTRQRVCINGLWQWQPAEANSDQPPTENWGYFKVPGPWPEFSTPPRPDSVPKDGQTVYAHPSWQGRSADGVTAAWYQREISVPQEWQGRRIALSVNYLNSYAAVYVDGKKAGEMRFPAGEVDLTSFCPPGSKHVLSMIVVAMPLRGVMLSFSDTNSAKQVRGSVQRRGLCGDVYLLAAPSGARIADVKIDTSVRKGEITFDAALQDLAPSARYSLRALIADKGRKIAEFTSSPFTVGDLKEGRIAVSKKWKAEKFWDIHTPHNLYDVTVSLLADGKKTLDEALPVRFGFREFWIDGRDFDLNGTRIFLSSLPLDNAQAGVASATYEGAKETMLRLQSTGINMVFTHNYGCEPGTHLSFEEILRAADDVGMLVSFSQPHFRQYDWKSPDADASNGYADHAKFYVRVAQNHPSVVFYAMSHNATGYSDDMNPDLIDGIADPRTPTAKANAKQALRADAIVHRLDPSRIVYHHSSGNLGSLHTSNFYPNWAPIQEMSDWFEHWSTKGVKPLFTCEYSDPTSWDWTLYRGWYKGQRSFGSAKVPWEFCMAEWNSQFLGDQAFQISEEEKANLRWEAAQFRAGKVWGRFEYPYHLDYPLPERQPVYAMYVAENWRAFRTWEMSVNSQWENGNFWRLRPGVDRSAKRLPVDWDDLQQAGLSADYLDNRRESMEMAFERIDWIPSVAAQALLRNNMPLLSYIAGKPARFTSKDHNFLPGEAFEKQLIIINNSRRTVTCECQWSLDLWGPVQPITGEKTVQVETGQQHRIPLRFELPARLTSGAHQLVATVKFSNGETQTDSFTIHVRRPDPPLKPVAKIALLDPKGETGKLLEELGVSCKPVDARADLSGYDVLIVGKAALTVDGPGPDVGNVRNGLKVLMFEQTAEVLEKRFGFRVQEYGLRNVFRRVPDHPALGGLWPGNLRDWRGEATILPPRLTYEMSRQFDAPTIKWCGIPVTRAWRCGNRGNVASVLVEKPARGNFLPIIDGGYSLQYSPLMEYREGQGMVLFCQMDVTGRTETDPAAQELASNLIAYVSIWKPTAERKAVYVGEPAGMSHLKKAGVSAESYDGGKLSPEQVLIVGPGGGQQLSANAAAVAEWLTAGGHVLAIGLDQADIGAWLPRPVAMRKAEHIAAYFEPFRMTSPLAGVGPSDVHNRAPREIPLLSARAVDFGDGVLATAEMGNVVFCQLVPWQFDYSKEQHNVKQTYRRVSFLVTRLLGNMGVESATPILARFNSPVDAGKVETRWLDGLYLDQPEEWDDPYRFFRW